MTRGELHRAFPAAEIWYERFLGMVKSMVEYEGFSISATKIEASESLLK